MGRLNETARDNVIAQRVHRSALVSTPTHEPQSRPTGTMGRVLVVDHIEANRRLIATILTRDGYAVDFASDGCAAFEQATRDQPDLVLMDVMMPAVDGIEACRAPQASTRHAAGPCRPDHGTAGLRGSHSRDRGGGG